ncbi:hypothetical protein LI328DRAFT_138620, partial [Trichoderma asperelloides]
MQFIWGGKIYWFWFFLIYVFTCAVRSSQFFLLLLHSLFSLSLKPSPPFRVVIKLSFPGTRVSRVSNTEYYYVRDFGCLMIIFSPPGPWPF